MTMIEKVARLLAKQDGHDPDQIVAEIPQTTVPPQRRPRWLQYVDRAAEIVEAFEERTA